MKTILITGANRSDGIGFHAARQLVALGHRVIITARNAEDLKLALARLGPSAHGIALDVKNEEELEALPGQVSKITDTLDVLVNNAGILLDSRMSALNVTKKVCEEAFLVNSIAPVLIVQRLLPLLTNSTSPRIINVSSGAAQLSDNELMSFAPAYSASKAALNAFTQQLTASLPKFAVNSVCPGWCKTNMGGTEAPRTPEEGAETIVWLATEAPQTLTGKFLRDREEIVW
jgi:NAD(P)-dependent dehydrogenase (short-subunit alcohol dehydrogenase family)